MSSLPAKFFSLIMILALWAANASAYEVWMGTHQWDGDGAYNLDQWDRAIENIDGINYVLLDTRVDKRADAAEWRTMIAEIDQSIPGMAEIARSQYRPGKNISLASRMENEFATVEGKGGEIDIIMMYDEERDGTIYYFTAEDFQEVRDWLDNNGQAHVKLSFNVRAGGGSFLPRARESLIDEILIEANATKWINDDNNLHYALQYFSTQPSTDYKPVRLQIPGSADRNYTPYQETRRAIKTIKELMGDEYMRSDQLSFIICDYSDNLGLYPETANDDTAYVNSKSGIVLSLMEQRPIFEGRVGVVDQAFCLSYDRFEVTLAPNSGLVAHWPLDEGTGNSTADVTGYGTDASLLNGASWGSDGTRSSYVSFDGTDDRIATAFNYALSDTDNFTWAWWAKQEAGNATGSIMVGNRYGGTGSESLEFIKFMPNKAAFADTGSAANIEDYNYSDLPSNEWHHYAMVKDGTSYQWYVDGIAEGGPVAINYNETAPLPFLIGGDGDNKPNEHFEGCIDDVVLYRSALTPADISNVINGIYDPIVTMVALGSPVDLTDASTWSDAQPAHANAHYVIPATGNLRSESGTSTFPGTSLKVEAGGKFQVRSLESDGETTTVDDLILAGGAGFGSGQFAEVTAGTGTNATNVLEGNITQSGATRLTTYASTINRSLLVNSQISGSGTLQAVGVGVTIANAGNTFSGTWETSTSLVFTKGGAVGTAGVDVQSGGRLEIQGDWLEDAALTIADTAGTQVAIGPNEWKVSSLLLGGTPVADGIYSSAELSALGSASFSGTGRVTVGTPPIVQQVIAGWDVWNSSTAPVANVTASGITATASASTASGNWSTTDGDGRGSSSDTTWGTFDGDLRPASSTTTGNGANMTALNGVTTAQITFTITNNGATDWDLDAFHMDVLGFRPGAPRTYQLEVLSGDITNGVVFTSAEDAITDVGGTLSGNNQHDDIDLSLIGLADSRLEPGESAVIQIAFSSGAGSAAGHHLFVDNVAISGVTTALTPQQAWRFEHFGTIENTGTAADSYDTNFDGENNLLEFATGQDPHARTLVSTPLTMNSGNLEFRYTRSKAALSEGMVFTVEWSETLLPDLWSSAGVNDSPDPENPESDEVENRIATVPAPTNGRCFIHLKVSAP